MHLLFLKPNENAEISTLNWRIIMNVILNVKNFFRYFEFLL